MSATHASRLDTVSARILEIQRLAGNHAVSQYLTADATQLTIQRKLYPQPAYGWGGTNDGSISFNPHVEVVASKGGGGGWYNSGPIEEVEVERGSSGTVTISNGFYWNYHGVTTEIGVIWDSTKEERRSGGPVDAQVTVTFTVGQDDKITFQKPLPNGTVGVPGLLDGAIVGDKQDGQDIGSVTAMTTLRATQSVTTTATGTKTTGTTAGGTAGIGGGPIPAGATGTVGVSGSGSVSNAIGVTQTGAGVYMGSFGVNLKVKKPPLSPPKTVTAKILYDREGRFLSGDQGILGVRKWWRSIPEPVREMMKQGKKQAYLYGSASATGTPTQNQRVVGERIKDVVRNLHAINPDVKVVPEDRDTEADDRSVTLSVTYTSEEASAPAPP
jgi:hypothetical protein